MNGDRDRRRCFQLLSGTVCRVRRRGVFTGEVKGEISTEKRGNADLDTTRYLPVVGRTFGEMARREEQAVPQIQGAFEICRVAER